MPNTTVPAAGEAMPAVMAYGTSATFLLVNTRNRVEIATSIERLINALDALEPDADLEPDLDAEPGTWPEAHIARALDHGDDEHREDDGTSEPWLGAPDRGEWHSQASWAVGTRQDREEDDDLEPSLGQSSRYGEDDLELDICDVPHDDVGDAEPDDMGWPNPMGENRIG